MNLIQFILKMEKWKFYNDKLIIFAEQNKQITIKTHEPRG